MTYITSPFSDGDYSENNWVSADFDISTMNPTSDANLQYTLNWDETRTTNGEYVEFRVDVLDTSNIVLIADVKKNPTGDPATFTLPAGTTDVKFKIKVYVHESFAVDVTLDNFKFNNKLNIIVNDGFKMLLDVMSYDEPNYTPVNTVRLGGEQSFYNKSFTAGDFEPKELGTQSEIYDNPDVVWEDLYTDIPFIANTTSTMDTVNQKIYVFGEHDDFAVLDLATDTWTTLTSLISGGTYHPVVSEYYSGDVYYMVSNSTDNKIYKYNVSGDTHTLMQTISSNIRNEGDSVLYTDKMYIMGGTQGLSNILIYDIGLDSTSTITATVGSGAKVGGRCAISDDKIYFFGGSETSNVYIYDITLTTWSTGTNMPEVKNYFGCVSTKNKYKSQEDIIYLFNGNNVSHDGMNSVQAYNTLNDTWETKSDTPFENSYLSTVTDGFYTYNIGGYDTLTEKVWRYEPEPISCIIDGVTVISDLQDRSVVGTCRIGSTVSTSLQTSYTNIIPLKIRNNELITYSNWVSNGGSGTVDISSLGFFNQDDTRQLFSYSKLDFEYDPAYEYRIKATFTIEGVNTEKSTTIDTANNGFLDRLFNGQYVSDYTYISKFLAGENTGFFDETSNTMTSENFGPTPFKAVTIDTGASNLTGTGNMLPAEGNGSDYDAFAMLCEEPGTVTEDNTLSFTDPTLPFLGTGSATLAYAAAPITGVLGMKYELDVDINSLLIEFTVATGTTSGTVELVSWDGATWNVEETLTDNLDCECKVSYKYIMNKEVSGIGLKFTAIEGNISVDNMFHAGNSRQMAMATKINNAITKTVDYNILVDMVENIQ